MDTHFSIYPDESEGGRDSLRMFCPVYCLEHFCHVSERRGGVIELVEHYSVHLQAKHFKRLYVSLLKG